MPDQPGPPVSSVARESYVVRVWLRDRPGALGAVAGALGSVDADLIGIDILEQADGRVIDELVVELASGTSIDAVEQVLVALEGVEVEHVALRGTSPHDPRLDALETAITLTEAPSIPILLDRLTKRAASDFDADWGVVLDHRSPQPLASTGRPPESQWFASFVSGSRSTVGGSMTGEGGDVLWANLAGADLTLVLGRPGKAFRARERRQATALVRVADARWRSLVEFGR